MASRQVSLQTKLKICISYYQIVTQLDRVYAIVFPPQYAKVVKALDEGTQEAATTSGRASAKTPSAKARDRHPSLAQCAGATSRASTYTGALLRGGGAAFPEPPRAPPGKGRSFGAGTPRQSTPLALDETQRRGSQLFSIGV